jgi:DNA-binding NtrC family response regulator
VGCLYLEGLEASLSLDTSDLIFLKGLASQIAVALDHSRLLARDTARQNQERQRLEGELSELREALQHVKLVHQSEAMESLLATVRRVAPTDATVLVNGESGTGKELIARTLHEMSPRRDKPLIVVDCAAIATTLMDNELFGHEKGAFTGADGPSAGRLADADQGTLVLDEIGELPREVQSKLLRFVQEKHYTPVGSSRTLRVDARVVAVTNRDLAAEVDAGRFREDLFHRLNVVRLVVPPLRERPDDILYLAQHFLSQFSLRYQKPIRGLTSEARAALLREDWPGNVRELQNRIAQAVILCTDDEIDLSVLGTEPAGRDEASKSPVIESGNVPGQTNHATFSSPAEAWASLRNELGRRIDAIQAESKQVLPLGSWLAEDMLVEAHEAAKTVCTRAAGMLGIPETTFRRRYRQVQGRFDSGLSLRPDDWEAVRACLHSIVRGGNSEENLLLRSRTMLLKEVVCRLRGDVKRGSAFMGVSEPTFRRWEEELAAPDMASMGCAGSRTV